MKPSPPGEILGGFFIFKFGRREQRAPSLCADPTVRKRLCAAAARNSQEVRMSAQILQFRDYQNPRDIERMQRELEKEAAKILAEVPAARNDAELMELYRGAIPYGGKGIDGMLPDDGPLSGYKDPA